MAQFLKFNIVNPLVPGQTGDQLVNLDALRLFSQEAPSTLDLKYLRVVGDAGNFNDIVVGASIQSATAVSAANALSSTKEVLRKAVFDAIQAHPGESVIEVKAPLDKDGTLVGIQASNTTAGITLTDATQNFGAGGLIVAVNDTVVNLATGQKALVTAIPSNTTLTLDSASVFPTAATLFQIERGSGQQSYWRAYSES